MSGHIRQRSEIMVPANHRLLTGGELDTSTRARTSDLPVKPKDPCIKNDFDEFREQPFFSHSQLL